MRSGHLFWIVYRNIAIFRIFFTLGKPAWT